MIRPLSKQTKQPSLPKTRRQYKSIFGLDGGLDTSKPSTAIGEKFTPSCSEMLFRNHTIAKAKGTQWFSDTNITPLLGSVMHIDQYYKSSGSDKLIVHTTRHTYAYNTDSALLECITRGFVIDDCEDVWTAVGTSTNAVTTDARKGSKSLEVTIPAGFTTGVCAYENRAGLDITTATYIHFYIKSSVTTIATTLDIRISEENAGGVGATYEDLSIPALVAGVWTEVSLEITTPANFNALLSVALVVAVDIGAMVVDIDDVMAVIEKTSNEDNIYSSEVMNNFYLNNHGVAPIEYWDMATATMTSLPGCAALGAMKIGKLGERVVLFHVVDTAVPKPQRVQWTIVGGISAAPAAGDWADSGSGDTDLESTMGSDFIQNAEKMGNSYIIYGERTIVLMEYTGKVSAPFSFYTRLSGIGLPAKMGIVNLGNEHIFMGWDNIYSYRGGIEVTPIGDKIKNDLFKIIAPAYIQRCFMLYIEENEEIRLYYPDTSSTTPNKYFSYNMLNKSWSRGERSYTGFGYFTVVDAITWDTVGDDADATWEEEPASIRWDDVTLEALSPTNLFGDTSGRIQEDNESTNNLVGAAIDGWWEAKDFVLDARYRGTITNWMEFNFEATGDAVDISYSLDQGATWSTPVTFTLTSAWARYNYDFNANSDMIRFKFRNNTLGETFEVREFEIGMVPASDRGL